MSLGTNNMRFLMNEFLSPIFYNNLHVSYILVKLVGTNEQVLLQFGMHLVWKQD